MPELPEVDRMAWRLGGWLAENPIIHHVEILRKTKKYLPENEAHELTGARIEKIWRRGKFLVIQTNGGLLVCHNAMSGFWDVESDPWTFDYIEGKRVATDRDVRIRFHVGYWAASDIVRFHDARLFGSVRFYGTLNPTEIPSLRDLGPEARITEMSFPDVKPKIGGMEVGLSWYLHNRLKDDARPIKEALMDQRVLAGLGNIYSVEALWGAKINPTKPSRDVTLLQYQTLSYAIDQVLRDALRNDLRYKDYIKIYRAKNCPNDGGPVEVVKLAGRSTYFCVQCQH